MEKTIFKNDLYPEPQIITFDAAADYVYNFIYKYRDIARNKACGGFIDLQKLPKALTYEGLLFWFCYNQNLSFLHPSFFLAFEYFNSFDPITPPSEPVTQNLIRTNYNIKYNHNITHTSVVSFLSQEPNEYFATSQEIYKSDVVTFNSDYLNPNYFPVASDNRFYNLSRVGFFWKYYLDQLLTEYPNNISGINYYFGLDKVKNRICVVVFGVDNFGNNITQLPDGRAGIILERMWPTNP